MENHVETIIPSFYIRLWGSGKGCRFKGKAVRKTKLGFSKQATPMDTAIYAAYRKGEALKLGHPYGIQAYWRILNLGFRVLGFRA